MNKSVLLNKQRITRLSSNFRLGLIATLPVLGKRRDDGSTGRGVVGGTV